MNEAQGYDGPSAGRAFGGAYRWLMQQGSGLSGAKRWAALREARSALRTHPYLGAPSEAFPGHRQHVVSSYRIIHRIDPDTGDSSTAGDVRIVTLFGPGER